jgi:hypothetical protein
MTSEVVDSPLEHPYHADIDSERRGWYELVSLVRSLTPDECLKPGYYTDPEWTVRDVVAHLGTWLAQAEVQFEQITAGTYKGRDIDVDGLNAALLDAMQGQPWEVAWVQANAARSRMLDEWWRLREQNDDAAWWIRKTGGDHYLEHLERLREWSAELIGARETE